MIKTVLYIATSLDGFIARPDGNLDWLTSMPNPQNHDYGYAEFLNTIGTIVMGRKTYHEIIGFGVDWPYNEIKSYVVTSDKDLKIQSPNTFLLTENLNDFVEEMKNQSNKDFWLVGGGQLIKSFLDAGLIDKMIITVIPKVIGQGIPLFAGTINETNWKLIEVVSFDTGVVNLTYEIANSRLNKPHIMNSDRKIWI